MRAWLSLALPTALALQAFAFGWDPARAATKVSFGQVSATATMWPGVVATKKGFFAANGVEMDTVSIGVSPGMQAVAAGSINIMHNTCNAVISFIESGGSGVHLSLVSMGIHPGVVVGKKGLKSASELKGKVVGTSSIKSGSTILLRRLLKARGLEASDYDVVAGQGSAQIFSGLQAGALDAVWLVPPQSLTATAAGYPVIGTFKEVAPKFPFVCFATNDAWVKANTSAAQGFARAWLAGVAWLYDPANRTEAEKLLAEALKLSPEIAAATYDD
jgi:ABC-type nitrate/sulfonate/bicarbonate transport system substrate-binding protein